MRDKDEKSLENQELSTEKMTVTMPVDEYHKLKAAHDLENSKSAIESEAHKEGVRAAFMMIVNASGTVEDLRSAMKQYGLTDEEANAAIPSLQNMVNRNF